MVQRCFGQKAERHSRWPMPCTHPVSNRKTKGNTLKHIQIVENKNCTVFYSLWSCSEDIFGTPVGVLLEILVEQVCQLAGCGIECLGIQTVFSPSQLRCQPILWHTIDITLRH